VGTSIPTTVDVFNERRSGDLCFMPIAGARMFELLSVSARDVKTLDPSAAQMVEIASWALDGLAEV
jgi:hypothetical protein